MTVLGYFLFFSFPGYNFGLNCDIVGYLSFALNERRFGQHSASWRTSSSLMFKKFEISSSSSFVHDVNNFNKANLRKERSRGKKFEKKISEHFHC